MDMIVATMLITAFFEVGKKLAEKALIDPALEKGLEPFKQWLGRGFDEQKAAEALQKAMLAALDETTTQMPNERFQMTMLTTGLSAETRQLFAAAAVEMTRNEPENIPVTLLTSLGLTEPDRGWLARYLTYLRRQLAGMDAFRPLMDYADALDHQHQLRGLAKHTEELLENSRRSKTLLELLTAERRLTDNDKQAFEAYLQDSREKLATIALPFVRKAAGPSTAKLTDVFVPLFLRDEKAEAQARKRTKERLATSQEMPEENDASRPVDFRELFGRYERFILIGLPGIGKTTLLRRAALAFAEGRAAEDMAWQGRALLPIFVRLRNFGNFLNENAAKFFEPSAGALVAYFEEHLKIGERQSLPPNFFDTRLSEGACLILLDGLDEVAENRVQVAQYIQKFIEKYGKNGNRIAISSRPKGYDDDVRTQLRAADLAIADVTPLQPSGIRQLIENLLRMDESRRNQLADDLTRLPARVLGSKALTELAGVPLFCAALVQVYKRNGIDLPQRRVDVLDEIVDLLLGYWHGQKDVVAPDKLAQEDGTGAEFEDTKESVEIKGKRLAFLAYQMLRQLRTVEIDAETAQDTLKAYFENNEDVQPTEARRSAKKFLRNCHERSGILLETAPDTYSFLHKNFLEYFAAAALLKEKNPIEIVLGILDEDPTWWDETILFAASNTRREDLHDQWTTRLLQDANNYPYGSEQWFRRFDVAGMMARDMTKRLPSAQQKQVRAALYQAATHADLTPIHRANLANRLDQLGYVPDDLYSFIPIPMKKSEVRNQKDEENFILPPSDFILLAKYPVTNLQYERFLKRENFKNPALWMDFPRFDENSQQMPENWGTAGWDWLQRELKDKDNQETIENGVLLPHYWHDARFGNTRKTAPVVGISWYEANAYCKWLSQQKDSPELLSLSSSFRFHPSSFRLPTEFEWQQSAGIAQYPWGNLTDPTEITRFANTDESSIGRSTPVWMYPQGASGLGIHDLSGNVWEWQGNYSSEIKQYLGLRGGSWLDGSEFVRLAARFSLHPDVRYNVIGFRLALPPN